MNWNGQKQIIAAVRDRESLELALRCPLQTVFLLAGSIVDLEKQCARLQQAGKQFYLHLDLLDGLKGDAAGIRFLATRCHPNGIISTKVSCLRLAREAGMLAILRVFVLDSLALRTGLQHVKAAQPHCVEVLPGVSAKIIRLAVSLFGLPVIAGGLVNDADDIRVALQAGAAAVSTSVPDTWKLSLQAKL